MQKWEYIIVNFSMSNNHVYALNYESAERKVGFGQSATSNYPTLVQYLNDLGEEGWEVIGMTEPIPYEGRYLLAKRPVR